MEPTHPKFLQIPDNSTLFSFGHCFLGDDDNWNITAFFKTPSNVITRADLAVEALPALALGRVYSKQKIKVQHRDMLYTVLPPTATWEKCTIKDVPSRLFKPHYFDECKNQKVYKINIEGRTIWLPVIELARVLFLKTAENTRCAFYEPNLLTLANTVSSPDLTLIRLAKHYPRKLLDSRAHREYLAWLLLNPEATNSFCSMYQYKYKNSFDFMKSLHWTFDFSPIELDGVTMNCYVGQLQDEFFIYEVRSLARIPTTKNHSNIVIEHPEDIRHKRTKRGEADKKEASRDKKDFHVNPYIDDREAPSVHSKHRVVDIPRGRLYFDALMEAERHFTEVEVDEGKGSESSDTKNKETINLGITEGDSNKKSRKTDFQTLPEPAAPPTDFFKHIRAALAHIKSKQRSWKINEITGLLSHEKPKPFLKVAGSNRRYLCGEIEVLPDTVITILEIDLSDKRGLSTLVMRLPPDEDEAIGNILDALVGKSGHWDRDLVNDLTDMCTYVAHPKELSNETPTEVYENWAVRILREL